MKNNKQIEALISDELKRAREKFPQPTNSPHEGFAVLLEEIEEMDEEMDIIRVIKDVLWKNVKTDNLEEQKKALDLMRTHNFNLIKEAIQVGAMIDKYNEDILSI
jgi:hypothetical protein